MLSLQILAFKYVPTAPISLTQIENNKKVERPIAKENLYLHNEIYKIKTKNT